MMKRFLALPICFLAMNAMAVELHDYDAIKGAVANGQAIRMVTDFSKCDGPAQGVSTIQALGSFSPNEIMVYNGHIAASLLHFSLNTPQFPTRPIYQYARYTITQQNTLEVGIDMMDAVNYHVLTPHLDYTCKIDVATKVFA